MKMRRNIAILLILASLCSAAAVSCGTVERAVDMSSSPVEDMSAASDETTDGNTDETQPQSETDSVMEETEDGTDVTEEITTETQTEAKTQEIIVLTDTPKKPTEAPEEATTEAAASNGSFTGDDMFFVYGDSQATVFVDASGLIAALGSPNDVQEAPGCLSNGADQKVYCYSGITVYTYKENDRDIIYDIEINSAAYSTPKGLKVGMAESEIERIYGSNCTKSGNGYCYYSGSDVYMYISTSGGKVSAIEYCADI